jgi:hypothetical protein
MKLTKMSILKCITGKGAGLNWLRIEFNGGYLY